MDESLCYYFHEKRETKLGNERR